MIENSLLVVSFSRFPFILSGFFDPATVWRCSSFLLALSWVSTAAMAIRRAVRMAGSVLGEAPILAALPFGVMALSLSASLLNVIGLSFGSASTMYFIGLFGPLLLSAAFFVGIVVVTDGG